MPIHQPKFFKEKQKKIEWPISDWTLVDKQNFLVQMMNDYNSCVTYTGMLPNCRFKNVQQKWNEETARWGHRSSRASAKSEKVQGRKQEERGSCSSLWQGTDQKKERNFLFCPPPLFSKIYNRLHAICWPVP